MTRLQRRFRRFMMRWAYVGVLSGMAAWSALGQGVAAENGTDAKVEDVVLADASFDVATIKPSAPNVWGGSTGARANGEFISKNQPLKNTICNSYGVLIFQCLGGPGWLESDHYDIEAKPDGATAERFLKLTWKQREPVQRRMQQALLADRLKLQTHFETREMTIFALVVAKGGSKIKESVPGDKYENGLKRGDGKPFGSRMFMMGNGSITAQGMSLDNLANNLPGITGHLVENRTGLTGVYDFSLHYSPNDSPERDSSTPSIYTALEEQLGLKLEPIKAPVKTLVIDHVERPTEN